jgi:ribosomal subunit interface protein
MNTVPLDLTIREIPNSLVVENKIREKADKLSHYCDKVEFCKVVLGMTQKQHHQGKLYNAHIEVGVPGKVLVATHKKNEDIYVAIRDAFDAMNRQVKRYVANQHGNIRKHDAPLFGHLARKFDDYGFIETPEGIEYYFHASNVLHLGFEKMVVGQLVTFLDNKGMENNAGFQACHVAVLEGV